MHACIFTRKDDFFPLMASWHHLHFVRTSTQINRHHRRRKLLTRENASGATRYKQINNLIIDLIFPSYRCLGFTSRRKYCLYSLTRNPLLQFLHEFQLYDSLGINNISSRYLVDRNKISDRVSSQDILEEKEILQVKLLLINRKALAIRSKVYWVEVRDV